MTLLSTSTLEADVRDFLNDSLARLFPDYADLPSTRVRGFYWARPKPNSSRKRDRWAGWYCDKVIYLDPDFFSGITDPRQQHNTIEDILLHELCHHVQFKKWGGSIPDHGREFRELAYFVNGMMGRDSVTIYHSLAKTPEGVEAERAQRKALALLARTTSSNEHEAALAASMYAKFTAANNIVLDTHAATLTNGLPVIVKEHVWTAKQMTASLMTILRAVAYVNGCELTYRRLQSACTRIDFYGRPSKISQSYDLLEYLIEAVDRCVKQAQKEDRKRKPEPSAFSKEFGNGTLDPFNFSLEFNLHPVAQGPRGRSYWIAFREGVARRAADALYADHKKRMAEGVLASNGITHIEGLVLQSAFKKEHDTSQAFLEELHPKLRGGNNNRGARSGAGRAAGYSAGSSVSVSRQTTGTASRSLSAAR